MRIHRQRGRNQSCRCFFWGEDLVVFCLGASLVFTPVSIFFPVMQYFVEFPAPSEFENGDQKFYARFLPERSSHLSWPNLAILRFALCSKSRRTNPVQWLPSHVIDRKVQRCKSRPSFSFTSVTRGSYSAPRQLAPSHVIDRKVQRYKSRPSFSFTSVARGSYSTLCQLAPTHLL